MVPVDSLYVRMIWDIVNSQSHLFLELSDEAICIWVLKAIKDRIHLPHDELQLLESYVLSRIHLMRDMASFT